MGAYPQCPIAINIYVRVMRTIVLLGPLLQALDRWANCGARWVFVRGLRSACRHCNPDRPSAGPPNLIHPFCSVTLNPVSAYLFSCSEPNAEISPHICLPQPTSPRRNPVGDGEHTEVTWRREREKIYPRELD